MPLQHCFFVARQLLGQHVPLPLTCSSSGRAYAAAAGDLCITNVWCVGRNYAEHIKELGNESDIAKGLPKNPMIFLKAGSSVLASGQPIVLPSWSKDVHHEVELAVQLGPDLRPVRAAAALDMTLRDVQDQLKKAGHPWTLAKSYKGSAPLGTWFSLTDKKIDLQDLELHVTVNGGTRQRDSTKQMLYKVDTLLAYIQERFPVVPGDVVLTGTPHGVSAIKPGDEVVAQVLSNNGAVLSEGRWTVVSE